jgi:multisubunit Na+/H+ antiporter MnhB subunit
MDAAMSIGLVFDLLLVMVLWWVAWAALSSRDLFRGIVLFIAFGMILSIAWIRLGAPDVALAEAAIGAGLTGALLLATWGALPNRNGSSAPEHVQQAHTAGARARPELLLRALLGVMLLGVLVGAAMALFTEPAAPGLSAALGAALEHSGAANPVTAVLLNFRGYDTLLEITVMVATMAGVWSLGPCRQILRTTPSPVLLALISVLTPLVPLVCAYLLWAGASQPGGAFQAGAVLATMAVLFILAGRITGTGLPETPMRWAAIAGLLVFLGVGLTAMPGGHAFLEYPPAFNKALMFLIEAVAMLSIAVILTGLFIGGRPGNPP